MSIKTIVCAFATVGVFAGCAAFAADAPKAEAGKTPVVEEEESDDGFPVSIEAGISLDSHYISYGLTDTPSPVVRPSGAITLFDWVKFTGEFVLDTTRYGRKIGIGNRRWQYWELDTGVALEHEFSAKDYEFLPTSVAFSLGYLYEYHPRRAKCKTEGVNGNPDTQFVTAEVSLPDLFIVPALAYERDIVRDNGTYVSFALSHEFSLIDADNEDDDPVLALELSAAQGFGNKARVKGYLSKEDGEPLDHAGLMDTTFMAELTWNVLDCLSVGCYVGYADFFFDRKMRDAARRYEPFNSNGNHLDTSWHILWGLSVNAKF